MLSNFFENESFFPADFFAGKHVVELGCGFGMPGMVAAALGAARVTLTEQTLESALAPAREHVALNNLGDTASVVGLQWAAEPDISGIVQPVDVILCSDLLYGDPTMAKVRAFRTPRGIVSHSCACTTVTPPQATHSLYSLSLAPPPPCRRPSPRCGARRSWP